MEYYTISLPNGIRCIHKKVDAPVAHCGIFINTGTRDEAENESGMAHFIEHLVFKGTKKRKAFHILSRLEDVGGEMNAYTSKEETVIYAAFLPEFYNRATELISDITFNSIYPEKEMKKEKAVIIDEINSYKDSPSEEIFDDFEDLVFEGNSLGRNILGTAESLTGFTRDNVLDFINRNYNTDQMIFCSVGNISHDKFRKMCEKYFLPIVKNIRLLPRNPITEYNPKSMHKEKNTNQVHCVMGNIAYSLQDERKTTLIMLNNILGGPGMNSRLNLSIREKYGFAYNIESGYTAYSDTGIFSIYLGTDKKYLKKSIELVKKELKKLQEVKLGTVQFHKSRLQLMGQIAISMENNSSLMVSAGKSLLHYGEVNIPGKIFSEINAITPEKLMETANEIFDESKLSVLIYE